MLSGGGGGPAPPTPKPPPPPTVAANLGAVNSPLMSSNAAPVSFPGDVSAPPSDVESQQSTASAPTSFPGDIKDLSLNGCDSLHTQNCGGIVGLRLPVEGVFVFAGHEWETKTTAQKLGLFVMGGVSEEDGWYAGGIGELGMKFGPLTASGGLEAQVYSQRTGFSLKGERFADVSLSLIGDKAGLGVMAPLQNNLTSFQAWLAGDRQADFKFSPYVFFPIGPIEFGVGVDVQTSRPWGWGTMIDGEWQPQ
jgi:hypothetical protein